jgi:putative heme-binding domain-containing protein
MVSNTEQSVTLRDAKGIEFTFAKSDIDELRKQEKSLMPENLHELISEQGLVDLVEYLTNAKEDSSTNKLARFATVLRNLSA